MKLALCSIRTKHENLLGRQELKSSVHEDEARAVGIGLVADDTIRLASKAEEALHWLVITGNGQIDHGRHNRHVVKEVELVTRKSFDKKKCWVVLCKRRRLVTKQ